MKKYSEEEINLLNIQIGCILRFARLKKGLSQHDLSLLLGSNPTMIGRIERFENISSWDKIYNISQELDVKFNDLFILKSKDELLSIVEESFKLEEKLTEEKKEYYKGLKAKIAKEYDKVKK
jgi:transcriptional regulator with XRE-family HTH domain